MNELMRLRLEEIRRRAQGALAGDLNYDPPVGDVVELIQMIDTLEEENQRLRGPVTDVEGAAV